MNCMRPATPGFVVTLAATILLAIVSFCVPYLKSVFFLRASISQGGVNGSVIFGTLGYCLELSNGTTCSKPAVGYELDINSLVGNKTPIQIPQVVVKWITTALVLHIAALIVAAASAFFGLLAHVREMSMTCCSTFISGFAAVIALLAFIFDLVLFFVAKARISSVGSAQMGSAIWLTLAAWVLLFFSGCFYSFGRCCISNRPSTKGYDDDNRRRNRTSGDYAEMAPSRRNSKQRHLDAVKAEADRKALQNQAEVGLPAFPEISETEPLTATIQGDQVHLQGDGPAGRSETPRGYVQGVPGDRAVDGLYGNTYPPQPNEPSVYSGYTSSGYASSVLPPATVNNVPQFPDRQHTLPTAYGRSYGYTSPSPPVQMPDRNQGPSYPNYPQYNPYGDNPYGEIRPSPSPHQVESSYNPYSLLNPPPMPSAPTPLNQPISNPYLIPPSPSPQQSHQPDYGAQRPHDELPPPPDYVSYQR